MALCSPLVNYIPRRSFASACTVLYRRIVAVVRFHVNATSLLNIRPRILVHISAHRIHGFLNMRHIAHILHTKMISLESVGDKITGYSLLERSSSNEATMRNAGQNLTLFLVAQKSVGWCPKKKNPIIR